MKAAAILCVSIASLAFAQIDESALRSKYGVPLDRQTFAVRPGIEMVVDYGPGKQVCKLQLPSGMNIIGGAPPGVITKQQTDQVLNEVVPSAMRGKELYRFAAVAAAIGLSTTEYEHVAIRELTNAGGGNGTTVTFKNPACPGHEVRRRLSGTEPEYTEAARKAGIEGTVGLEIGIDAAGAAHDIFLFKSLDSGLDTNCMRAVEKWRFEPGNPTQEQTVECHFALLTGNK